MLEEGVADDRLAEFQRTKENEDARLRAQLGQAYQFMNSPLAPHSNSPQGLALSTLANALRSVGGLYLANRGEGQIADANAAAAAEHDSILAGRKKGRGAAMDSFKSSLGAAILDPRSYDDGSI